MGGFNRRTKSDSRPKSFAKRNFSGRSFGDGYTKHDDRDSGRGPSLHQAVCSSCGKECEVPFRPNGKKPVFCSICFDKQGGAGAEKFGKKSFDRPRFEDGRKSGFERSSGAADNRGMSELKEQLAALTKKVDKILLALESREESEEDDFDFDEPAEPASFKMKTKVPGLKKTLRKK